MIDNSDISIILNIIIVGDASVGKTNLCSRYTKNIYSEESAPTIGADFVSKIVEVRG